MTKLECFEKLKDYFSKGLKEKVLEVKLSYWNNGEWASESESVKIKVTTEVPTKYEDSITRTKRTYETTTGTWTKFYENLHHATLPENIKIVGLCGPVLKLDNEVIRWMNIDTENNKFDVQIFKDLKLDDKGEFVCPNRISV